MENHFDTSYLIPGTDEETTSWYAGLYAASRESFELLEDEVVVMDTETTGLDPHNCQLIEIAACILRGPEIVDRFQTFVNPGHKIPAEITELTSITNEDVRSAPDPSLAVEMFANFAGDRNIVAHNADFDRTFVMRQAVPGTITGKWMDSLAMARIVLPRMRSHRLKDLSTAFNLPSSTHRADADVEATAYLWRILLAGAYSMQPGLADLIASLSPLTDWPLRALFSQAALSQPGDEHWSLRKSRSKHAVNGALGSALQDEEEPMAIFPTDAEIARAFSADGIAGRMYEGYEQRKEQLAMATEVTEAFRTSTHRSLEAGTGVGKSMAYLLPAALTAKVNNTTIGVATKTNALMDQLVYNELPRLSNALEGGLDYVALKGYEHYPCLRKLESMARNTERELKPEVIEMEAMLLAYVAQTPWGDLDAMNLHWYGLPRYAVEASSADCLKNRCPFFPLRCYLHGARRMAKRANILVTNHALLFRDVQTDNGILPPIEHWIVDEAHAVESEARRQLSHTIGAKDLEVVLNRIGGSHGTVAQIRRKASELDGGVTLFGKTNEVDQRIGLVLNIGTSFFSFVKDLQDVSEDRSGTYDYLTLWVSPQVRQTGPWMTLEAPGRSLGKKLDELVRCLTQLSEMLDDYEELSSQQADLSNASCRLDEMRIALELVLDGGNHDFVYSAQINRNPDKATETLEASCLDVGKVLAADFYPNTKSVIYTSATLATGSNEPFSYFEHGAGLDELDAFKHPALQLDSSYDFDANMKVLLPQSFPEPNAAGYHEQLAELLMQVHVAMGGSVLTLFTNRRDMEHMYKQLKPRLEAEGVELIAQTKGISTKNLRDRFLADRELSLFALRSFWEGFDAPGETLRCVVIPRLPFGRPNDPISQERNLREGRQAWSRYSLPEAVMDLKQAAGRLIRNSTDSGYLVLCDGRLQTKGYGKVFLKALPTTNIRTMSVADIATTMRNNK